MSIYPNVFSFIEDDILYEDPDFPADDISLYGDKFSGKRESGKSVNDIKQGDLGDCWLLAAIASLTKNEKVFENVVPAGQSFKHGIYTGKFRFNFWHYGEWTSITIDDRLPTLNGKLVYACSDQENEFWTALLEKAYAKLYGSYKAIECGEYSEAVVDFTGNIVESIELNYSTTNVIYKALSKCLNEQRGFIGCSVANSNTIYNNRLKTYHSYSIIEVEELEQSSNFFTNEIECKKLKIFNPWNRTNPDKYEKSFTLDYSALKQKFTDLNICFLNDWKMVKQKGRWVNGLTSGGCINYKTTFHMNHQYALKIDKKSLLIIGLMQKDYRLEHFLKENKKIFFGFVIFHLNDEQNFDQLNSDFLTKKYYTKSDFNNSREIVKRIELEPGKYIIIPSTFYPNYEGEFLLRIFSDVPIEQDNFFKLQWN